MKHTWSLFSTVHGVSYIFQHVSFKASTLPQKYHNSFLVSLSSNFKNGTKSVFEENIPNVTEIVSKRTKNATESRLRQYWS